MEAASIQTPPKPSHEQEPSPASTPSALITANDSKLRRGDNEHKENLPERSGPRRSTRVRRRPREHDSLPHSVDDAGLEQPNKGGGDDVEGEEAGGPARRKRRGPPIRTRQRPGKGYTRCGSCGLPTPTRKRFCPSCGVTRSEIASKTPASLGKESRMLCGTSSPAPQGSDPPGENCKAVQTGIISAQAGGGGTSDRSRNVPPHPWGMAVPPTTWAPWLPRPDPRYCGAQHVDYWAWAPPPPSPWQVPAVTMFGHDAAYPAHPAQGPFWWLGVHGAPGAGPHVAFPSPWTPGLSQPCSGSGEAGQWGIPRPTDNHAAGGTK